MSRTESTSSAQRWSCTRIFAIVLPLALWALIHGPLTVQILQLPSAPHAPPPAVMTKDGRGCWALATNLARRAAFSRRLTSPYYPDHLRTPGYPLILLALRCLGGWRGVIIGQSLLHLGCVFLVMAISHTIFRSLRIATCAASLFSLSISSHLFSLQIASEIPFQFFFLLGIFFSQLLFRRANPPHQRWSTLLQAVVAGLSLGFATLVFCLSWNWNFHLDALV